MSVPSQSLRDNLKVVAPHLHAERDRRVAHEGRREGERPAHERGHRRGARRSTTTADRRRSPGPNLALEIAKEQPTAAVVSSTSLETAQAVASVARNRYFHSFVNTDVIGTEFGGVLKNLIAVAIGIVDGVGLRREHQGVDHHPRPRRDDGLRGRLRRAPRDAVGPRRASATSSPRASRRSRATTPPGRLLGQGYHLNDVVNQMQQTTEGLASVAPILELAAREGRRDAHRRAGAPGARRHARPQGHRTAPHDRRRAAGRKDDGWTSSGWFCCSAGAQASTRSAARRREECSGDRP